VARTVVSVVRSAPAALRVSDPVLEANAYAVAEDVDLVVVLRGAALEHALAQGERCCGDVAGVELPPAAGADDLSGLLESGMGVLAAADDLARQGLHATDLVPGVRVVDAATLAGVLRDADAVLTW
jgi:intracellular sulfur oxidation DsrE/DsrF family protein